jgi:hypothetical protein
MRAPGRGSIPTASSSSTPRCSCSTDPRMTTEVPTPSGSSLGRRLRPTARVIGRGHWMLMFCRPRCGSGTGGASVADGARWSAQRLRWWLPYWSPRERAPAARGPIRTCPAGQPPLRARRLRRYIPGPRPCLGAIPRGRSSSGRRSGSSGEDPKGVPVGRWPGRTAAATGQPKPNRKKNTAADDSKPNRVRPAASEARPAASEARPAASEARPAASEARPAASEARPAAFATGAPGVRLGKGTRRKSQLGRRRRAGPARSTTPDWTAATRLPGRHRAVETVHLSGTARL